MVRTECMICDGCGKHDQISQTDARNAVFRTSDFMPDGWVLVREGAGIAAYHDILCAYQAMMREPEQGSDVTATQLAMFGEGESE